MSTKERVEIKRMVKRSQKWEALMQFLQGCGIGAAIMFLLWLGGDPI